MLITWSIIFIISNQPHLFSSFYSAHLNGVAGIHRIYVALLTYLANASNFRLGRSKNVVQDGYHGGSRVDKKLSAGFVKLFAQKVRRRYQNPHARI
jgi:hypothetical protein